MTALISSRSRRPRAFAAVTTAAVLAAGVIVSTGAPATAAPVSVPSSTVTLTSSAGWDIYTPDAGLPKDYRYGPSFIINADDSIDMWACAPGATGDPFSYDYIGYQHSTDNGVTWSGATTVNLPTLGSRDAMSTCDPGVIKFGGYYYLAYDSTTNRNGTNNQIYVARSTSATGPFEKWNGTGWGGSPQDPQPFLTYDGTPLTYGIGGTSMVVVGTTLYIYYTWVDNNMNQTRMATASTLDEDWPASVTKHGVALEHGPGEDHADVKYVDSLGKFVAIASSAWSLPTSAINVYTSTDGLSFTEGFQLNGDPVGKSSNAGLSGDASGHITTADQQFLSFAVGDPTDWHWSTRLSPISFGTATTGALRADFQSGASDWTAGAGTWTVSGGEYRQSGTTGSGSTTANGFVIGDGTIEADVYIDSASTSSAGVGIQFGKRTAADDANDSGYVALLRSDGDIALLKSGTQVVTDTTTGTTPVGNWVHLRVTNSGGEIKVYVGAAATPQIVYSEPGVANGGGFVSIVTDAASARVDNVAATNTVADAFSTASTAWTDGGGTWSTTGGVRTQASTTTDPAWSTFTNQTWGDGVFEVDARFDSAAPGSWLGVSLSQDAVGDAYWESGYLVAVQADGSVFLYKGGSGAKVVVQNRPIDVNTSDWFHITVIKLGKTIQVYVGDVATPQIYWNDPGETPVQGSGYVSLVDVKSAVSFDNFAFDTQRMPGGSVGLGASDLPNVALGRPVTSNDSITPTGWDVSKLTDNIEAPSFGSAGYTSSVHSSPDVSASPIWIEIDLGSDQRLMFVKLFPRIFTPALGGGSAGFPVDFTIQVKPTGGSYTTVKTVTDMGNPTDYPQLFDFTPTVGRYVRIEVTELGAPTAGDPLDYVLQLSEIQVIQYSY